MCCYFGAKAKFGDSVCKNQTAGALNTGTAVAPAQTAWQEFLLRSKWLNLLSQNIKSLVGTTNREIN